MGEVKKSSQFKSTDEKIFETLNSPLYKKDSTGQRQVSSLSKQSGYRWLLCVSILTKIDTQEGFNHFLNSGYFNQDEIDFVLFNVNDLKSISKLSYFDFLKAVKEWKEC
jgi:hypothetical protein